MSYPNQQTSRNPWQADLESIALYTETASKHLTYLRTKTIKLSKPVRGIIVLIEPREHSLFEFTIRNWTYMLAPFGWGLVVVHGKSKLQYVQSLFAKGFEHTENVIFMGLSVDDLPIPAYNQLLTSKSFWSSLPHENVLIVQTDTMCLSSVGFGGGNDTRWLSYDYIGAPWWSTCPVSGRVHLPEATPSPYCGDAHGLAELAPHYVGNGGLSFRKKSAMIAVLQKYSLLPTIEHNCEQLLVRGQPLHNEDVFFAVALKRLKKKIASRDTAVRFSVECVPPLTLDPTTFVTSGVHKLYQYLPFDIVRLILQSSDIEKEMKSSSLATL